MKASQLLEERRGLQRMLERFPTPIIKPHLEAAMRDIDAALLRSGVTPPGREPNDHLLTGAGDS